ncbi:hypothetical protein PUN28_011077 [Cardiocondyla obscurior]|uniref:Uncharacterized protein n=1 Tax=Cardiocondyla obscurior TaxID=286306 RepID=A0AAW2FJ32_9HYME
MTRTSLGNPRIYFQIKLSPFSEFQAATGCHEKSITRAKRFCEARHTTRSRNGCSQFFFFPPRINLSASRHDAPFARFFLLRGKKKDERGRGRYYGADIFSSR